MDEKKSGMEEIDAQKLFEILCECYARANGLIIESVTIKRKENSSERINQDQ